MPIFKIEKQTAQKLKKDGFGNEADLRDFFAENLNEILGVRFLAKEYQTTDGFIDTLGLDENNSPAIIEYKWKENDEVFLQGLSYFGWLKKSRKEFELLVKNKLGSNTEVNWDQPRVILIAQGFSRRIKEAVETVTNVELKTYALYEGNILHIENDYSPIPEKNSKKRPGVKHEDKTTYDLNYHLNIASPEMQKRMNELRDKILQLPSVDERVDQKTGITYRTTKSFTRLQFKKTWIQVLLRDPKYKEDAKGLVKDIASFGFGYLGMIRFTPDTDVNYLFNIIKASYNSTL